MWKFKRPGRWCASTGFSLTELMVGLALGLMVVLAAMQSLTSSALTATTLNDSVELQQKAESAFDNLGRQVMQAGAIQLLDSAQGEGRVSFSNAFAGVSPLPGHAGERTAIVHGAEGSALAGRRSDRLRTGHEDDRHRRDCLGQEPRPEYVGLRIESEYWVDRGRLRCRGNGNAASQWIIDGVEHFEVRYGTLARTATEAQYRFYNADEVPDWSTVQAVSVCLQLVGESAGHPTHGATRTGCNGHTLASDGRLHRVFLRTFSLRNALP